MRPFAIRWFVTTLAVLVVSSLGTGISTDSTGALLAAGLLLGVLNALVRPVLMILSLPLIVFTMGFFILVINAVMLLIVSGIIPGFHVASFGSAMWSSILISLVSWPLNAFFRGNDGRIRVYSQHTQIKDDSEMKSVRGRVIE
ncbi:MAG: phage holin family protein [Verrucomicrobiota bacterium]